MTEQLKEATLKAISELYGLKPDIVFTRPEEAFGDYATNAALQLAGQLNKNPRDVANQIAEKLRQNLKGEVSVAGPGFINIRLSDTDLFATARASTKLSQSLEGQTIVAEYSDPNPFKVLHAGHLYTSVVGDAVANLLEAAGARVHRVNFGGDVGLHVAKAMWGILKKLGGEHPEKLAEVSEDKRSDWLSERYVEGNKAYESSEQARAEIVELNKRVYRLHDDNDKSSSFARIYWTCRQWSYDCFNSFYSRIGSRFEKYYPESQTASIGIKTVKKQLSKGVYEESDGAVVFRGEKYGLHTRVFINSEGLPTYETKDIGLIMAKWEDYHFDKSVVITGNDIIEYMKVVLKSIEQFAPKLAGATVHLTHGIVKLAGDVKMSSRLGNILRATDVLEAAAAASLEVNNKKDDQVVLGAVKYAFLRQRIGGDIIYDPKESVNILGNSGPYLQYALVRARSIQRSASQKAFKQESVELDRLERSLARKISIYPEAFKEALDEYSPHIICNYLYELAQTFNRFYEKSRVVGDPREGIRLSLVESYENVLSNGLKMLGIPAPEKM